PPRRTFGIPSAHDRIAFKVDIAPADLETDRAPRGLFVDTWRDAAGANIIAYAGSPVRGEARARCRARLRGMTIEKTVRIAGAAARDSALEVGYAIAAARALEGTLEVQLDLAMPSAGGPGGRMRIDGAIAGGFATELRRTSVGAVALEDDVLGGTLLIELAPACAMDAKPLVTVSRSESGFEKIMQAVTLTFSWPLTIAAGGREELRVNLRCATARS
ncbi:MAG: DUF1926 domain-containing protein, partial [Candidatus Eremiobacteraeota bacterium]|nr:DUF1926 domain-containing protein [Candidatus Eremiobacteraeota bacterium]